MADKFSKTHPWRFTVLREFEQDIGALIVNTPRTGQESEIAPPRTITQRVGERMARTKREATEVVAIWRAKYGADVVSDVFKAPR